jgi:hypothetical protein
MLDPKSSQAKDDTAEDLGWEDHHHRIQGAYKS